MQKLELFENCKYYNFKFRKENCNNYYVGTDYGKDFGFSNFTIFKQISNSKFEIITSFKNCKFKILQILEKLSKFYNFKIYKD